MGILPSDIVCQVLSKLPTESLLKFRCVSKQWLDWITDPFFKKNHTDESKHKPLKLRVYRTSESCKYEINMINPLDVSSAENYFISFPTDTYTIMYSSGILPFYGADAYIHVCNPSTREVSTINHNLSSEISLLDIDERFPTAFGFLPSTSQYKIIDFFNVGNDEPNLGIIKFCLVTLPNKNIPGSWKYIHVDLDYLNYLTRDVFFASSICVSGIVYWRKFYHVKTEANKLISKFLTFDLEAEEFRDLTCPLGFTERLHGDFLVDLNGVVCLVDVKSFEQVLYIWILKDSKNEIWAKEYTVNFTCKLRSAYWSIVPFAVIGGDGKKKIIFDMGGGSFYLYNLGNTTFRELQIGEENMRRSTCKAVHYGSFLPVSSCRLMMPATNF